MTEFVPTEKGQTIRYPSTANLCIDSQDRKETDFTSPFDFTIVKRQNILSGFFTRIATTEFVINWNEPNIQDGVNDTFGITIGSTRTDIDIPTGFYTVEQLLDEIKDRLNLTSTGTWSILEDNGFVALRNATNTFTVYPWPLAFQLFNTGNVGVADNNQQVLNPDLRLYKYIDIVSQDLTYNQDLKDATTGLNDVTSLCRVYLTYPTFTGLDAYGFPIKFGYKPDTLYRNFTSPKQIKWNNIMPIGNLSFQVLGSRQDLSATGLNEGRVLPYIEGITKTEWQMTLQVSEV
jgi:hypothetical protein